MVKLQDDTLRHSKIGEKLANDIDDEWRRILNECYFRAKEIVIQNERRVERIAEALLAEQTILAERFVELWGDDEVNPVDRISNLLAKELGHIDLTAVAIRDID